LSASKKGGAGVKAFQDSWNDNKSLIYAASFAGGAVWLATSSILYYLEKDNEDMLWCYPPASNGDSLPFLGSSHSTQLAEHEANKSHSAHANKPHIMDCACTDDGCTGADCLCQARFKSIPSSMFFVLLSLAGEFPLADKYGPWGRVVAAFTAVLSVGIFAIPTGLVGAALEGAISALNDGDEKDYDVDEEDVAEIVALARGEETGSLHSPSYTNTPFYKSLTGYLIVVSAVFAILSTVESVREYCGDSVSGFLMFYALNVCLCLFFLLEWIMRLLTAGAIPTLKAILTPGFSMQLVDLMSWLPEMMFLVMSLTSSAAVNHQKENSDHHQSSRPGANMEPWDMHTSSGEAPPVMYFPAYISLTAALFRMIKYERYIHGFKILDRVLDKSMGVLMIGGAAAAVITVFASTLMYYAERHNPDPHTQKYYSSIPMAMWMTTLNLSGEAPLCDYTTAGSLVVGILSITACAIFAIPVGALGSGFEAVISEIKEEQEAQHASEDSPLLPITTGASGDVELKNLAAAGGGNYGAIPTKDFMDKEDKTNAVSETTVEAAPKAELTPLQRIIEGRSYIGEKFLFWSLMATLFAVALEIISTVDYSSLVPGKDDNGTLDFLYPSPEHVAQAITFSEFAVVIWFTVEYFMRITANGWEYAFSFLGFIDAVSTFPYYFAHGLGGPSIAKTMDIYDGPLRAVRICRLVRLDAYVPSLTLIDDAVRECWAGLSVALFAGMVIWFLFNECLYFSERDDVEEGENKRFRSAFSSLQYSAILLSGDYPIVDFSLQGKLACSCAVIIAVGIVAVPASILAGAFVELLQQQAEERRKKRFEAASKMQTIFLNKKAREKKAANAGSNAFTSLVKNAMKNSAQLRGLDADPSAQPLGARICIWKNNRTGSSESAWNGITGVQFKSFMMHLIGANIIAVLLESIPEVESALPHWVWQGFETASVLCFSAEYVMNIFAAKYDPRWNFSRWEYLTSFIGTADYVSISPFYLQMVIIPAIWGVDSTLIVDATVFRMLRLARIIELEQFFEAFTNLNDVFTKAGPVLKATGVLALILWVGGATAFYYTDPHSDDVAESFANGGETPAVFTSIVDALYYMSIFMAGEWCVSDFSPIGSVLCTIFAIVGVALFSIPVGVLFEGFQDMLEEKHAKKEEEDSKKAD